MKRLIGLGVLTVLLGTAALAQGTSFDATELEAYVRSDETDAGFVTTFEWSQSGFWTYQTRFDEYDGCALTFEDGSSGVFRLDFALADSDLVPVPYAMLKGVLDAPADLSSLVLSAGNSALLFDFLPVDHRLNQWEEYDGEYEFSLMCPLGTAGTDLWREALWQEGAVDLIFTRWDGTCAKARIGPLPPWDEAGDSSVTAFDLFYDGLTRSGYVDENGNIAEEERSYLSILEDIGLLDVPRCISAPDGLLTEGHQAL